MNSNQGTKDITTRDTIYTILSHWEYMLLKHWEMYAAEECQDIWHFVDLR